uniref:Uncharacterized protein n=1 Tax=Anguilla anguilla TaxID=7936 RepID=A0A0E9WV64_ANGAN
MEVAAQYAICTVRFTAHSVSEWKYIIFKITFWCQVRSILKVLILPTDYSLLLSYDQMFFF